MSVGKADSEKLYVAVLKFLDSIWRCCYRVDNHLWGAKVDRITDTFDGLLGTFHKNNSAKRG